MTLWLLNMSLCRPVKLQAFFGTVAVSYDCFQHSPLPTNDWWLVDASGLGSGRCLGHMIHGAPKHEETKNISIDYWTLTGNQDMFFLQSKKGQPRIVESLTDYYGTMGSCTGHRYPYASICYSENLQFNWGVIENLLVMWVKQCQKPSPSRHQHFYTWYKPIKKNMEFINPKD